jgi:hypothetical protein
VLVRRDRYAGCPLRLAAIAQPKNDGIRLERVGNFAAIVLCE